MRFGHSVTISPPRPPGDQSPSYRATPHQWGLKAGFRQRRCEARTLHVRAECANFLLPSLAAKAAVTLTVTSMGSHNIFLSYEAILSLFDVLFFERSFEVNCRGQV